MVLFLTNNPKSHGDGIDLYLIAIFEKTGANPDNLQYQDNEFVSRVQIKSINKNEHS